MQFNDIAKITRRVNFTLSDTATYSTSKLNDPSTWTPTDIVTSGFVVADPAVKAITKYTELKKIGVPEQDLSIILIRLNDAELVPGVLIKFKDDAGELEYVMDLTDMITEVSSYPNPIVAKTEGLLMNLVWKDEAAKALLPRRGKKGK